MANANSLPPSNVDSSFPVSVEKFSILNIARRHTASSEKVDFQFISVQKMNNVLHLVQRRLLKQKENQQWSRFIQDSAKLLTLEDNCLPDNRLAVPKTNPGVQTNESDVASIKQFTGKIKNELKEVEEAVKQLKMTYISVSHPGISRVKPHLSKTVKERTTPMLKEKRVNQIQVTQLEPKQLTTTRKIQGSGPSGRILANKAAPPPQHRRKPLECRLHHGKQVNKIKQSIGQKISNKSKPVKNLAPDLVRLNDIEDHINVTTLWQQLTKIEQVENSVRENLRRMNFIDESVMTSAFSPSKPITSDPHQVELPQPLNQSTFTPGRIRSRGPSKTSWKVAQELSNSLLCDLIDDLVEEMTTLPDMFLEELLKKEFVT